jgi:hypothetical protein
MHAIHQAACKDGCDLVNQSSNDKFAMAYNIIKILMAVPGRDMGSRQVHNEP